MGKQIDNYKILYKYLGYNAHACLFFIRVGTVFFRPADAASVVHSSEVAWEAPSLVVSHHTCGPGGTLMGRLPSRVDACQSRGLLTGGLLMVSSAFW